MLAWDPQNLPELEGFARVLRVGKLLSWAGTTSSHNEKQACHLRRLDRRHHNLFCTRTLLDLPDLPRSCPGRKGPSLAVRSQLKCVLPRPLQPNYYNKSCPGPPGTALIFLCVHVRTVANQLTLLDSPNPKIMKSTLHHSSDFLFSKGCLGGHGGGAHLSLSRCRYRGRISGIKPYIPPTKVPHLTLACVRICRAWAMATRAVWGCACTHGSDCFL